MRVLITTDVVGGVWQFTHELAAGLLRAGWSVALVSLGGSPTPEQQQQCARLSAQFGDSFLYENSSTPLEWMQQNEGAYHEAAPMLSRIATQFRADLLHANQFCFGALPLDIPKVITAHSDVLSWAEACRAQPLENTPWLRQYCRLVADGINGASLIVTPTNWMMSALKRNFAVRARCEVIANGRTIAGAGGAERRLRAVTAGRLWDEAKDVRLLSQVASPVPLFVAGETRNEGGTGPEDFGPVTLLGRLGEERLLEFFRESAIYICPSRYEPFGLAPLEAALCGCAVLARDIPSLREVWQDGARYFAGAEQLSNLLRELAEDTDALQLAQRSSLARAQWFTAERMVACYQERFKSVVKETEAATYAA